MRFGWPGSTDRLDPQVRERLPLGRGERPLAWTYGAGVWLVGTASALHVVGDDVRTIAWERIERADWQSDDDRLVVVEVADWGTPEPRHDLVLDDPVGADRLLQLLRERVTRSIVVQQYVPVRGRAGVTVVGRQAPTGEGPVQWSYVLGKGLDPDDPQVQRLADEARAVAARELQVD